MINKLSENIKNHTQPNKIEEVPFSLSETTEINLFYLIKFWVVKNLKCSYL